MRDSILDAVDEAEGRSAPSVLPLVGGALAIGTGIGYLLGAQELPAPRDDSESVPVELPAKESVAPEEVSEDTDETGGGGGRLGKLLAVAAVAAAVVYLKRRRDSGEEGWEPVEEIDSAVDEVGSDVEAAVTGEGDAGDVVSRAEETDGDDAESETEDEPASDQAESETDDETSADEE